MIDKRRLRRPKMSRLVACAFFLLCWFGLISFSLFKSATNWHGLKAHPLSPVQSHLVSNVHYTNSTGMRTRIPRCFLHIGPHKTATTSIQCALYRYQTELYNHDSTVFLGKVDSKFCNSPGEIKQDERIKKLDKCVDDPNCWGNVTRDWDRHKQDGYNMVLSKEGLSDWALLDRDGVHIHGFWSAMAQALRGFEVTVLLTYRSFFDWLPSAFYQHAYHMRLQARQPWPKMTDTPPETFEQHLMGVLAGRKSPPYPFVDYLVDFPFPVGWKIQIADMQATPDIVQLFFCHIIDANHTCSIYEPTQPSRESPAEAVAYDALNVEAVQRGWITGGRRFLLMQATKRFIRDQLQLRFSDLPVVCPSRAIMEAFLARSITLERTILGDVDVAGHSRRFWDNTEKFCTVNVTHVLLANASAWKRFYQGL